MQIGAGILGEYVGRLFQEAKARPLFMIDRVVTRGAEHALPAEFSALGPAGRRDVYEALRSQG